MNAESVSGVNQGPHHGTARQRKDKGEYGSGMGLRIVSSLVLTRLLLPAYFGEVTLVFTLITGNAKLDLYKNGDLQDIASRSISGTSIVLTVPPIEGDELRAKYLY